MGITDFIKLSEIKLIKDLNSPEVSQIHGEIIQKKLFLKKLYIDFYKQFKEYSQNLPKGILVEIGSGGGFLKEVIPEVITTDTISLPSIDIVISGVQLPFEDNSVKAFFLQNVLHHIKDPKALFCEMQRCLVKNGKIIMIEPHNSLWGAFVWKNSNSEPFNVNAGWTLENDGRLSSANSALPWIIFFRDRKKFENEFPL